MRVRTAAMLLLLPVLVAGTSCAQKKEGNVHVMVAKSSKAGYLGVQISDMTPRIAKEKKLKVESGALVGSVVEDSPAEKAGIKEEDVIVEFNGKKVADADDLVKAVGETKPGTKVNAVVMREGKRKTLQVEVGKSPETRTYSYSTLPSVNTRPEVFWSANTGRYFGLRLMDLNKQLGEYFGTPDGRGVLVEEVLKDGAGEKAGFKAGDVIIRVGKESIRRADDIRYALEDLEEDTTANVTVLRKGQELTLNVAVKEMRHGNWGPFFRYDRAAPGHLEGLFEFDVPRDIEITVPHLDNLKESLKIERGEIENLQQKLQEEMKSHSAEIRDLQRKLREEMNGLKVRLRTEPHGTVAL